MSTSYSNIPEDAVNWLFSKSQIINNIENIESGQSFRNLENIDFSKLSNFNKLKVLELSLIIMRAESPSMINVNTFLKEISSISSLEELELDLQAGGPQYIQNLYSNIGSKNYDFALPNLRYLSIQSPDIILDNIFNNFYVSKLEKLNIKKTSLNFSNLTLPSLKEFILEDVKSSNLNDLPNSLQKINIKIENKDYIPSSFEFLYSINNLKDIKVEYNINSAPNYPDLDLYRLLNANNNLKSIVFLDTDNSFYNYNFISTQSITNNSLLKIEGPIKNTSLSKLIFPNLVYLDISSKNLDLKNLNSFTGIKQLFLEDVKYIGGDKEDYNLQKLISLKDLEYIVVNVNKDDLPNKPNKMEEDDVVYDLCKLCKQRDIKDYDLLSFDFKGGYTLFETNCEELIAEANRLYNRDIQYNISYNGPFEQDKCKYFIDENTK